ncbi:MAG: NOP58 family protein [Candidatus Diapherotrites archaeon]|nr:NOP58 family protein [Candidatus Diapherotrites archaeon]
MRFKGNMRGKESIKHRGMGAGFKRPRVELLREELMRKAKKQVALKLASRDLHVVRAAALAEDLESVFNLLAEQVLEWHAFHFPELKLLVRDPETCIKLVAQLTSRDTFSEQNILPLYANALLAKEIACKAGESAGALLNSKEAYALKSAAKLCLSVSAQRRELGAFIESECKELVPNLHQLLGGMLAAKLLRAAGGLERLAFMPSSAVQVLGAEKALFAHLKEHAKPPKHGLIFQFPLVKKFPSKKRGKMARFLAGKISIAARVDAYGKGKTLVAPTLLKQVEARAKSLSNYKG